MHDRFSLRARLVAVTVALVAIGLTVAGFATYHYLEGFLVDRVDTSLAAARDPALGGMMRFRGPRNDGAQALDPGTIVELRGSEGTVRHAYSVGEIGEPDESHSLPARVPEGYSTVALPGGSYRVLSSPIASFDRRAPPVFGERLVVAVPLRDVNATLDRLVWIEVAVGIAVLAAVAALALWLVRVGLAPLRRIEETAGAIAAGDLSRRIDEANPRTEVGRLSESLNAMLAQIEQAFAEQRASENRLRRFVADASHELRTPLTSVRGYAELFRRGAAERPDDLATAMGRIEAEAVRMGVLVDDLLLLAHLDQGRELEREPVDLSMIASELCTDARAADPGRPLELDASEPVVVTGDEPALRQVVANLLANTRAHTPDGTPVRVRVARAGAKGVLEVADSGPGIPAEQQAQIFERFYRADASRTRATGGTGLGLSIVAALVEAQDGRISVSSTLGSGATFRVELPLAVESPRPALPKAVEPA